MGRDRFQNKYKYLQDLVESWIADYGKGLAGSTMLDESLRYSLLSGGKRIRPVLCLATGEALGVAVAQLQPFALALELLHTSSLVHDDLPALDDDDVRRGQPTCHKRFGEAIAVLSGDLLMMEAFKVVSNTCATPAPCSQEWSELLARAGTMLCHGQALDLMLSGRAEAGKKLSKSNKLATLRDACIQKTAALFQAAVLGPLAFISAEHKAEYKAALERYGEALGLLFQISDDLLDPESEVGVDNPSHYVSQYGRQGAISQAATCLTSGLEALHSLPGDFSFHEDLLDYTRHRTA